MTTRAADAPRRSPRPRPPRARLARTALACVLALPASILGVHAAGADEVPQPTAHYDMTRSGDALLDVSGNGLHASLTGTEESDFVTAGEDQVLRLDGDAYASLPQGLVTGEDNDFTVEFTASARTARDQVGWVIGDGVGPWNSTELGDHVFVNPVSSQSGYDQQVLAGIRVKRGEDNGEVRLPAGGGIGDGVATITLVGAQDRLTLYLDGEEISSTTHDHQLADIVPDGDVLGYLGRSLYSGDEHLDADVTDVKFWDETLTPAQLRASQPSAQEKAAAAEGLLELDIQQAVLGDNPSLDRVSKPLHLAERINGVDLTWSSSDESVVAADGTVSRDLTADATVELTARTDTGTTLRFEVTVLAPSLSADLDAIELAERTTENLPLAVTGAVEGSDIVWESSDPQLVSPTDPDHAGSEVGMDDPYAGGGLVTRPAYGAGDVEVTLTATATLGHSTESREFVVTVAERARTAPDTGYAAAYFRSDSDERIYSAATTDNDFFTFEEVNDGQPVVDNSEDTTGHRDPYILRSHDGDKYYMIATDLCIGCGTGWDQAQSDGSLKVNVWESADLVHWERTNGDGNGAIEVNQPEAGMTWAAEAYWDDELQSYVLFFASRLYDDVEHTAGDLHARMFAVLTRDFVTFTSPPQSWQDTGHGRIDSTVQKIGDHYYRFTKNEDGGAADGLEQGKDIFLERSKVLTAPTTASDWDADPETGWQLVDTAMTTPVTGNPGEGPQIAELNEGDPNNTADDDGYVFLVDNYSAGGYRAFVTSGAAIAASGRDHRLSQQDGWQPRTDGLPASPRHGSFVSAPQQVIDAMHEWRPVEAAASETTISAEGRTATATVAAEDDGEVAGTVTFTGQDWSETVTLTDGRASAEVPETVQEVTARYEGYSDGLVDPSRSAPLDIGPAVSIDASTATRCVAGQVVLTVTAGNTGDEPVTATITTPLGERSELTLGPGRSTTAAFSSRRGDIAAGQVTVVADGAEAQASYPAASCG
ncbi:MAG TPA: immunoglobulin-like domain-containing protein [Jiangellaceae bacterium]|nr:immunoglobulin-like domain-containing protein [Jiangellaceae bacterium]